MPLEPIIHSVKMAKVGLTIGNEQLKRNALKFVLVVRKKQRKMIWLGLTCFK